MLRALTHYFLIGGLMFAGKVAYDHTRVEKLEITVRVPTNASPSEVERAVREAILLQEARRRGWDRKDPVVYSHLVRNMRFIEPQTGDGDSTLYHRALEMNMHAHDPIVRARLLYRANDALGYVSKDDMPEHDELQAHLEENPARFQRPGTARFWHVFLSRTKRGNQLSADATEMRSTLDTLEARSPEGLGDPLPGVRTERSATVDKLRAELGTAFADAVGQGVSSVWRGPIPSVYGLHFVRVVETTPAYLPTLDDVALEVREDLLRSLREELRDRRMAALRERYSVQLERGP